MKTIMLSVTEFAILKGITRQAVIEYLNKGKLYPEIVDYKKVGNTYVLHVLKSFYDNKHA